MRKPSVFNSINKAPVRLSSLALTALLMWGTHAQADEVIFSGTGTSDWQLFLGSSSNWSVWFVPPETTTHIS